MRESKEAAQRRPLLALPAPAEETVTLRQYLQGAIEKVFNTKDSATAEPTWYLTPYDGKISSKREIDRMVRPSTPHALQCLRAALQKSASWVSSECSTQCHSRIVSPDRFRCWCLFRSSCVHQSPRAASQRLRAAEMHVPQHVHLWR